MSLERSVECALDETFSQDRVDDASGVSCSGLTPTKVERIWGVAAKAHGFGTLGFSAALWDCDRTSGQTVERLRPSCDHTHVVSIWTRGTTVSELYFDNKLRFRRVRRRGTFQLSRAGESLRVLLSETSGSCLDLYLPVSLLASVVGTEFDYGDGGRLELLPLKLEADPVITRLGDEMAAEIERPGVATQAALDAAALTLCVNLVRRWSNLSGVVRPSRAGLTTAQVRKATSYLKDTMHRDVSLQTLAEQVGLSPFHFARAFKAAVGVPPHQYQIRLRMMRARELLENTMYSVGEVATQVGYDDASYFSRVFRREHGVSPGQFRRAKVS